MITKNKARIASRRMTRKIVQSKWWEYNTLKGLYEIHWQKLDVILMDALTAAYLSGNEPDADPDLERDEFL